LIIAFNPVDIWDGDEDDGPIVYHGYTMVSKLLLKDVLEAIGAYAFDTTTYPLILSLEVNCSSISCLDNKEQSVYN
jgi:hypothetical protein